MSLLELRHVSKAYNEKFLALEDVNLKVERANGLPSWALPAQESLR